MTDNWKKSQPSLHSLNLLFSNNKVEIKIFYIQLSTDKGQH